MNGLSQTRSQFKCHLYFEAEYWIPFTFWGMKFEGFGKWLPCLSPASALLSLFISATLCSSPCLPQVSSKTMTFSNPCALMIPKSFLQPKTHEFPSPVCNFPLKISTCVSSEHLKTTLTQGRLCIFTSPKASSCIFLQLFLEVPSARAPVSSSPWRSFYGAFHTHHPYHSLRLKEVTYFTSHIKLLNTGEKKKVFMLTSNQKHTNQWKRKITVSVN